MAHEHHQHPDHFPHPHRRRGGFHYRPLRQRGVVMSRPTRDFLRAWLWAIAHRPAMTPGVIAWMTKRLAEYDEGEE